MANTYTLPIASDRDRVRLKIGDTDTTTYAFEDGEVDEFLSEGSSVNGAAGLAILSLLANKALRVKRASEEGISYDDTAQIAALTALYGLLDSDLPEIDVVSGAALPMDTGFVL